MKALTPFKECVYSEHICSLGGWRSLLSQCIWAVKELRETLWFIRSFVSSCWKPKGGPRAPSSGMGLNSLGSASHTQGVLLAPKGSARYRERNWNFQLLEMNSGKMSHVEREDSLLWAKERFRLSVCRELPTSPLGRWVTAFLPGTESLSL